MSEVSLSPDEEFLDLAADLDGMRRGLREKIDHLKEQQRILSAAADELSRSALEGKLSLTHSTALQTDVERKKASAL